PVRFGVGGVGTLPAYCIRPAGRLSNRVVLESSNESVAAGYGGEWAASSWLVSTFTLQTLNSLARASTVGFMARHGGHHEAQKTTSTGSPAWRTSFFQLNSCSSIGLPL